MTKDWRLKQLELFHICAVPLYESIGRLAGMGPRYALRVGQRWPNQQSGATPFTRATNNRSSCVSADYD